MDDKSLSEVPLDCLLASLCYLMSRYAVSGDLKLAQAVVHHLAMLPRHPQCRSDVLANLGQRLTPCWRRLAQADAAHGNERCAYH